MGFLTFDKARYFNRHLAISVALIAISTFNYGFDNQAFATTQSMNHFAKQFGNYNHATGKYAIDSQWLSLFNSLNYIGFASGVLIGSFISARFGRRWCMFSMSCYALVTATITVTSNKPEQIMAGRILNYVYVGMELAVVPIFQSEIVPAPVRGLIVGTYQFSLAIGGLVINCICYGTSHLNDNRSWRIPLSLFYVVPTFIAVTIFFVPESPRWLLRQNRAEEAKKALYKLRKGAFTEQEIDHEFSELQFALESEAEQGKLSELFQGVNLRRTLIVVAVNFFQQAVGQAFASQYGAVYVRSLGIFNPVLFSVMSSGINSLVMILTLFTNDRAGRRTMLMISSFCMCSALMIMGGLGVQEPVSTDRMKGVIGLMIVFGCSFSLGWAPLTYVVATEVISLRLRDLTSRLGFTVNVIFNFAVSFSVPYMVFEDEAGLGSKVGFIFGAIAALSLVFTYFCVPECKGKTLEQVDWLFNKKTPLRDFGKADVSGMLNEGARPLEEKLEDIEKEPSRTAHAETA